jgi:hypothetical protein
MSQDNVNIVRRIHQALSAREVDLAPQVGHPDMERVPDRRLGVGPVRGLGICGRSVTAASCEDRPMPTPTKPSKPPA